MEPFPGQWLFIKGNLIFRPKLHYFIEFQDECFKMAVRQSSGVRGPRRFKTGDVRSDTILSNCSGS